MKTIILLGYKKRAGKDTVAKMLKEKLPNSEIIHFADALKEIIATTLDIDVEALDYFKNNNYELEWKYGSISFRKLLQRFGTEAMKPIFGNNVWARIVRQKIEDSNKDFIIIPDFRFKEEYEYLLTGFYNNLITVKVERDLNICEDSHSSEKDLEDFEFDLQVNNLGTLDDLKYAVDEFLVPTILDIHYRKRW